MTEDDVAVPDGFAAARHALSRARSLRARGVPFEPVAEIAALQDAVLAEKSTVARQASQALEAALNRVEIAWAQLDLKRASVAYLTLTLERRPGPPPSVLAVAQDFVRRWNVAFQDAETLEARVVLATRLETALRQQVGSDAPDVAGAPAPVAVGGSSASSTPAGPAETTVPPADLTGRAIAWLGTASGLTFLLIGAFTLLGAYDRLHGLGNLSLWNDEAQTTLVSFSILQHGYPLIQSGHLINNFEPLYPYFEAGSIALFGYNNFAFRLPAALLGIALVPISYYVGTRLRDRYVGITLAAMTAFSSEMIAWSRQARWYILLVVLMALAFWVATLWTETSEPRRRRWLGLALGGLTAAAALASVGLFLLYVPGIVAAVVVYLLATQYTAIRAFFGLPTGRGPTPPPARWVPYRIRRILAIVLPIALAVAAVLERARIGKEVDALLARSIGFTPYPLVYSSNFGTYLEQYYLGVLALVFVGSVAILVRKKPLELALLAFCGFGFLGVATLASLTNDIAGGTTSFERHMLPLLYFLFLVGAMGLVDLARLVRRLLVRLPSVLPKGSPWRPAAFGVIVVVILVLPGIAVPSGVTVHNRSAAYPGGLLVRWEPFSFDPAQPSAIYQSTQANYQLASEYVAAHRNSSDVIAATNPGPPQVYLGPVQYWVRGDADPTTIIYANGQPEFFQTGSLLVNTTAELENVLFNSTGWLISDVPGGTGGAFPDQMSFLLAHLMDTVPAGSDNTITLYEWNLPTRGELMRAVAREFSDPAGVHNGTNLTAVANWEAVFGVTSPNTAPLLLPIEGYLVRQVNSTWAPLATLLWIYNNRAGLQERFPGATGVAANDTALIHWADEVCTGEIADPAQSTLLPYATWYEQHG